MKVGFIGTGIMGRPMAMNLLQADFFLTVFNRTSAKCEPLISRGATRASSPAEVTKQSDVIITMVSDTLDVESVLFGANGVWSGLRYGERKIVVDMSTISPRATIEYARRLKTKSAELLDAPVSGGELAAQKGTLAIMVGGKQEVLEKCLPIFKVLGKTIVYTGASGCGQKTKLVNQISGALNLLAMTEGLRLARAVGLDLQTTLQVVSSGAASSWMLTNLGPKILSNDFAPGFSINLHYKDLKLARELIVEIGEDLPGSELIHSLFALAVEKGLGGLGNQGLINLWEGGETYGVSNR